VNEQLLDKVLNCSKLPSLPGVALRVIELTSDDNVNMKDLAKAIESDQALAARILRTVNSAFYGLSKPCSTLTHAQSLLGLNAVKTLALGFTLVETLKGQFDEDFDYVDYWRRQVFTAVGAKAVASHTRCCEVEEAFLGGLLQDIGMIAMSKAIGKEYNRLVNASAGDHHVLVRKEIEQFELQHPDVGAMLAERWKLPFALVAPIKYHERPTAAPRARQASVRSVALGGLACEALCSDDQAIWITRFYKRAHQWFAICAGQADDLLEEIVAGSREMSKLLDLDVGPMPDIATMLGQANERLVSIAMAENNTINQLASENQDLQRALSTDSLTGLLSRRRFGEMIRQAFDETCDTGDSMSVILLDVDAFRIVNDEYGPEVGDVALARLAGRLTEAIGGAADLAVHKRDACATSEQGAWLFRYGGEQFVALLIGADRRAAAATAKTMREAVAASPIPLADAGGPSDGRRLTVSAGVATLDPSSADVMIRPERLINAADKAVRAAKAAGGDCVRVFTPMRQAA